MSEPSKGRRGRTHGATAWRLLGISLLACVASCQRDDVPLTSQPASAVDPLVPAIASSLAASSSPPARDDSRIPMPGPGRKRIPSAVAANRACEACHQDIAKEWLGSYHQRANSDPALRAAFAIEPFPFCRSCHAPEADPRQDLPDDESALGVGCVTCHVTEQGMILAAAHPGEPVDRDRPPVPHALHRSAEFASVGACAGCHEFRFPAPGGQEDEFFMQTTVREHLRSPAADKPCAHCHMPQRDGHRSHTFAEVRSEAWLRAHLDAKAERTSEDTLRITLTQPDPGHAFPTGDLFRRLQIGYELVSAGGQVQGRELRYLARHFEFVPGRPGRHLSLDDRVESEPKVVEFDVPLPADVPGMQLSWWVTYQRPATVGKGTDPNEAIIESGVKLHSGSLPWNSKPLTENHP